MFVTDDMIAAMVRRYGQPHRREFSFEVTEQELVRIRSSQKEGRNHDVTLYADKDGQVIVIAKHMYPPGLFRAPSGGLKPGESFEVGIEREMTEETGCAINLDRFLLQTSVRFKQGDDFVAWRSFVFLARYVGGDFEFTDRHEIKEVRLADWTEFDLFSQIMRATEIGGLHYRAALHDTVVELMAAET